MMKQFIRLCVAAALAVTFTGAHAIKLVSGPQADPGATMGPMDSVTYAKETLLDTATKEPDDGVTYYDVARTHYISGPTKIYTLGTANDAYVVRYSLEGMVFSEAPEAFALSPGNGAAVAIGAPSAGTNDLSIILGGAAGDSYVVFQAVARSIVRTAGDSTADPVIPPRDPVILLQAKFSISEEGSGGITRVVQNRALRDIGVVSDSETHELSGAIRALPGIVETVTPNPQTPTAVAEFDFMQFENGSLVTPDLTASVGTVMLGVKTPHYRNAQATDANVTAAAGITVDENTSDADLATVSLPVVDVLTDVIGLETDAKKNGVTFSGDFSFPSKVAVGVGAACAASGTDIRVKSAEDADVYTDMSKPQTASTFLAARALCIHVDGKTEIPITDTYKATTKYEGIEDAAFPPPGGEHMLSHIDHDGTTYRIPYITTYDGYNQRISIVNRGGPTTYAFTGLVSAEGTVMAGSMASGPLPTGQTILRSTDVVTITGGNRAAGNLTIVADPGAVSAVVQQVNKETRTVDTVYLQHMLR